MSALERLFTSALRLAPTLLGKRRATGTTQDPWRVTREGEVILPKRRVVLKAKEAP